MTIKAECFFKIRPYNHGSKTAKELCVKLYYGKTSPYVRKVLIAAIECDLDGQITLEEVLPWTPETRYPEINPLGKIPALETDAGQLIYDSRVIVEYLDGLHARAKLIPQAGTARFEAFRIAALADGMMEAMILLFSELQRRPSELHWPYWDDRMRSKVTHALDQLEKDAARFDPEKPDLAQITTASGVAWLAFRYDILGIEFQTGRPRLTDWFEAFSARRSMSETVPVAH